MNYNYNEGQLLKELEEYIIKTYGQHYASGRRQLQAFDFIMAAGHGKSFTVGNVMKYIQRYGKKGTDEDARKDLLKVLHYTLLLLYCHDQESNNATKSTDS